MDPKNHENKQSFGVIHVTSKTTSHQINILVIFNIIQLYFINNLPIELSQPITDLQIP